MLHLGEYLAHRGIVLTNVTDKMTREQCDRLICQWQKRPYDKKVQEEDWRTVESGMTVLYFMRNKVTQRFFDLYVPLPDDDKEMKRNIFFYNAATFGCISAKFDKQDEVDKNKRLIRLVAKMLKRKSKLKCDICYERADRGLDCFTCAFSLCNVCIQEMVAKNTSYACPQCRSNIIVPLDLQKTVPSHPDSSLTKQ